MILSFLKWLAGGHSPATVSSYRYGLFSFQNYLDAIGKPVTACALDDLTGYLGHLEARNLKSKTRSHYSTCLRSLWRWLERQGLVPFRSDLIPIPSQAGDAERRPFLGQEEYDRMLASFDEYFPIEMRNKAIIAMLFATGTRIGELLSMDVSCLDLDGRKANVRTFKRKRHYRDVYWGEDTHRILLRWLETRRHMLDRFGIASPALFIGFNTADPGRRVERHAVARVFRELRAKLKIDKPLTPHSCRHGFATKAHRNGAEAILLKEMLGHANIQHTLVYTHSESKQVEGEYRRVFGSGN